MFLISTASYALPDKVALVVGVDKGMVTTYQLVNFLESRRDVWIRQAKIGCRQNL